MTIAIIQTILAALSGYAIFMIWKASSRRGRLIAGVIAAGLVIRLAAAQAFFWVAWLDLPILRGMHFGEGYWFFALDAKLYYMAARFAAAQGPHAILNIASMPFASFYVQVLSIALFLFGAVTVTSVLINGAAYAGTSALMAAVGGPNRFSILALCILALSPSAILWATQPLKDVFFMLLIALFIAAAHFWERGWRGQPSYPRVILAGGVLCMSLSAISSIRWYVAAIQLAFLIPFLLVAAFRSSVRGRAALGALALIPLAVAATLIPSERVLARTFSPEIVDSGKSMALVGVVEQSRVGFDNAVGQTMIGAGPVIQRLEADAPSSAVKWRGGIKPPRTRAGRLIVGTAMFFMPRAIATRLGLVEVSGGRGLWAFAELDTIWFDVALALAIVSLVTALRSGAWRSPLLWLVAGVAIVLSGAMAYTISNFGTMLRLRDIVFMHLIMIPVLLSAERMGRDAPLPAETSNAT